MDTQSQSQHAESDEADDQSEDLREPHVIRCDGNITILPKEILQEQKNLSNKVDELKNEIASKSIEGKFNVKEFVTRNEGVFYKFQLYVVPDWAKDLRNKPTHIVKIANLNTPIHKWNLPGLPCDFKVYIKRDDMTGAELSGSKVRPLQVLLAEALEQGAKHVVSGGGSQSCFTRAVSLTCRLLGLTAHVIAAGPKQIESLGAQGNNLLSRLAGSKLYLAPYEPLEALNKRISLLAQHVRAKYGEKCVSIPVGGTTAKAEFMYLSMFEELLNQGLRERLDDVVVAVGSGGMAIGLAIGNYLTGSPVRIHAVSVVYSKDELYETGDSLLHQLGIDSVKSSDILDIIEGYIGKGYGIATDSGLDFITKVSSTTGILLDPCYTGKAAFGMVEELHSNPSRFKGKRILFIHTGGIFNLFDGEMGRFILEKSAVTNDVTHCQVGAIV